MLYDRPVRELLVQAVVAMPQPFGRDQVVEWFRKSYPAVKPSTVTAHITAATVNSRSRHHYPGADQHLIYKRSDGLLERYDEHRHGKWDASGEPVSGTTVQLGAEQQSGPAKATAIGSGQVFEVRARTVCSRHFGVSLNSAVVEIPPGVGHQFDLVSPNRRVIGDAKWHKNIPVPAAKFSVIAEYVWLLQHLPTTETKFIVFGRDREVPERWLKRFRPLAAGVDFYFLSDDDTTLFPL